MVEDDDGNYCTIEERVEYMPKVALIQNCLIRAAALAEARSAAVANQGNQRRRAP